MKSDKVRIKELEEEVEKLTERIRFIGKKIYQHGEEAYRKGIPVEDNPWKGTPHKYHIWKNGWIMASNREWKKKNENQTRIH